MKMVLMPNLSVHFLGDSKFGIDILCRVFVFVNFSFLFRTDILAACKTSPQQPEVASFGRYWATWHNLAGG